MDVQLKLKLSTSDLFAGWGKVLGLGMFAALTALGRSESASCTSTRVRGLEFTPATVTGSQRLPSTYFKLLKVA